MKSNEKSWKIEGDTLSPDLAAKLNEVSKCVQEALDALPRPLAPPWLEFPDYSRTSMGWRMGGGEDYMAYFREWFLSLSEKDRQAYIIATAIPDEWAGWLETIQP
ncbi:hypothetical protein [Aliiroseovarius sp. F20344]|uniref:hypothetical protein n=1 Tax=Aliiroseovarius sp. F20344 TaxID=2926414 RepID=UPI001FF3B0DC|nr:hypothetical protein [Aliiroseovarius sp. F20344]MCK0142550.1 hypothetical protein [Aliiroseovarius sp. F20344]